MKTISIFFISLIVAGVFAGQARTVGQEKRTFYKNCIEQKIAQCQSKRALVNSRGGRLKEYGKKKNAQVSFLQDNQEKLIKTMIEQDIPRKEHKVDHFLNKAFADAIQSKR